MGCAVGNRLGLGVGSWLGLAVGSWDGGRVGRPDGAMDGLPVQVNVKPKVPSSLASLPSTTSQYVPTSTMSYSKMEQ